MMCSGSVVNVGCPIMEMLKICFAKFVHLDFVFITVLKDFQAID